MPARKSTPAEIFQLVAKHAAALREAGATSVEIEGVCKLTFAAPEPQPQVVRITDADLDQDALNDAWTYGHGRGVPGVRRERTDIDE